MKTSTKMSKAERKKKGINILPANLGVALDELESDRSFLNSFLIISINSSALSL